jgi:hypothetical protein
VAVGAGATEANKMNVTSAVTRNADINKARADARAARADRLNSTAAKNWREKQAAKEQPSVKKAKPKAAPKKSDKCLKSKPKAAPKKSDKCLKSKCMVCNTAMHWTVNCECGGITIAKHKYLNKPKTQLWYYEEV